MAPAIEFKSEYLFLEEEALELPPSLTSKLRKENRREDLPVLTDYGRRSLLADLNFLIYMWNPVAVPRPVLVHLGGGFVGHMPFLAELFPALEIHVYSGKNLGRHPRVHSHHREIETDVQRWAARRDVLLIANLNRIEDDMTVDEEEEAGRRDLLEMIGWWKRIAPFACSLRFRPPRTARVGLELSVPLGRFLLTAYGAPGSLTTRLLIGRPLSHNGKRVGSTSSHPQITIDVPNYLRKIDFHNQIVRRRVRFLDPFDGEDEPLDDEVYGQDYDSLYEIQTLFDYYAKIRQEATPDEVVNMSEHITRELERIRGKPRLNVGRRSLSRETRTRARRMGLIPIWDPWIDGGYSREVVFIREPSWGPYPSPGVICPVPPLPLPLGPPIPVFPDPEPSILPIEPGPAPPSGFSIPPYSDPISGIMTDFQTATEMPFSF